MQAKHAYKITIKNFKIICKTCKQWSVSTVNNFRPMGLQAQLALSAHPRMKGLLPKMMTTPAHVRMCHRLGNLELQKDHLTIQIHTSLFMLQGCTHKHASTTPDRQCCSIKTPGWLSDSIRDSEPSGNAPVHSLTKMQLCAAWSSSLPSRHSEG